jgi:hypothetical protein
LNVSNLLRVMAAAAVLSTLSFAAGVAGDLSLTAEQTSGTRVVLRIPPEIPDDAPRAAPIALLSTASAAARPMPVPRLRAESFERAEFAHAPFVVPVAQSKPPQEQAAASAKPKDDPGGASQGEKRRKNG